MFTQKFEACLLIVDFLNMGEYKKGPEIMEYLKQAGLDYKMPYLQNFIQDLKLSGLVVTSRGRQGGYKLANRAITALDIYEAAQGKVAIPQNRIQFIVESMIKSMESCFIKHGIA